MASEQYVLVSNGHQEAVDMSSDGLNDIRPIVGELNGSTVHVTFDKILYDVNLRLNQRIFCVGASILLICLILVLFLFLLIGFGRVMNDLSSEKLRISQGLRMVPDFGTAITNSFVNLSKDKVIKGRYGSIIRDYLEAYKKEQISRSNFTKTCEANEKPSHAWCEFPLKVFDTGGCTAVNNYGFDNGEPCFLFEFKLHSNWTPKLGGNETVLPLECGVYDQVTLSKGIKITYISASGVSSQYGGFPLNKVTIQYLGTSNYHNTAIKRWLLAEYRRKNRLVPFKTDVAEVISKAVIEVPSRTILDDKGRDVCDENGETLYDQPALVLVKLRLGKSVYTSVRCFIGGDTSETSVLNLSAMRGNRDISFDIFYPYAK